MRIRNIAYTRLFGLLKMKKCKRISGFYNSNYVDLLSPVKSKKQGKKYFDPYSQLCALWRLEKIRE
jgi:hypothetical protein